eukprot:449928-Amphidinium_carterae.1
MLEAACCGECLEHMPAFRQVQQHIMLQRASHLAVVKRQLLQILQAGHKLLNARDVWETWCGVHTIGADILQLMNTGFYTH